MLDTIGLSEINFLQALSIITPVLLTAVGWGIRAVIARVNRLDEKAERVFTELLKKMDANRVEIREYLKEYVRRETCRAHREAIHKELDDIKAHLKFGRRYGDNIYTDMVKHFNGLMKRTEDNSIDCEACASPDMSDETLSSNNDEDSQETSEANI